jgi:hypothetical protein
MDHQANRILEPVRFKGVLRTPDVDSAGASRALFASLTDEGKLLKPVAACMPCATAQHPLAIGPAMTEGVDTVDVADTQVRVFGVTKTFADSFKFCNKTGLDVALEALREPWKGKRAAMDELWRYAEV